MSNRNFDKLDKQFRLKRSEEILAGYKETLSQGVDTAGKRLSISDYEWLNQAVAMQERQVAACKMMLDAWWC